MSTYATKNVEHFDKRAASYDSPLKLLLAKQCSDAFLQAPGTHWSVDSTKVIDFACGTGLPSRPLVRSNLTGRPDFTESRVVGETGHWAGYEYRDGGGV